MSLQAVRRGAWGWALGEVWELWHDGRPEMLSFLHRGVILHAWGWEEIL